MVVVAIIHSGDGGASDGGSSHREEEMGLINFLRVCVIMSAN